MSELSTFEIFSRLVQEDLLILEKENDKYFLKGGILCFPAAWSLSEKINKNLFDIHLPINEYDKNISSKVDRMFLNLFPYRTIWRANWLLFDKYDLYQPTKQEQKDVSKRVKRSKFIRVEKQTITKFDFKDGILFTIHTYIVPITRLTDQQLLDLKDQVSKKYKIKI
mgnify:CR=1 FL=1